MAWIIRGKTKCSLCEQIIEDGHEIVTFPPLYLMDGELRNLFSDVVIHRECFLSHPLKTNLIEAIKNTYDPDDSSYGAILLNYVDDLDAS